MQSAAHYWSALRVKEYLTHLRLSVNTSIDLHLTFDWHRNLHSVVVSVDTWTTLNWHLSRPSAESWLIFADTLSSIELYIWICLHSTICKTKGEEFQPRTRLNYNVDTTSYQYLCIANAERNVTYSRSKRIIIIASYLKGFLHLHNRKTWISLKDIPTQRGTKILFCRRGLKRFSPLRSTNS